MVNVIKQHLNNAQIRSGLIFAPEEWAIWSRGTGKTTGLLAPKSARYLDMMPRCTGVFVAATFQQLLTRTLKPTVAGWERMGYKRGVHFLVGEKPTKKWIDTWRWKGPYQPPFDYSHFITWWNGAGIQMISQDRVGSSNGVSIDFIMGDEAKLLNEKRLKEELFPANRGIYKELADNPHHHGKTFITDMPVGTAGRWILDQVKKMDPERLESICTVLIKLQEYRTQLATCNNKTISAKLAAKIAQGNQLLNILRKNFVYYHESNIFDNIDAVGIDYVKEELRSLSKFQFSTAILNLKPYKLEDGFYPKLIEEYHGYFSYEYNHFHQVGYDFDLLDQYNDSRKDGDIEHDEPLHIAGDYNRRIWPIVTGQPHNTNEPGVKELRILSGHHVLGPKSLDDAIEHWCNYYRYHRRKEVYFWFDHTAIGETRNVTVKDDICSGLRKRGWIVHEMYIGQQPDQETRYLVLNDILEENGKYPWIIRYNRDNCKYLGLSLFQAQAKEKGKGFGKDKSTEHDPNFPAEESTHYTDAFDTLVWGITISELPYTLAEDYQGIIAI